MNQRKLKTRTEKIKFLKDLKTGRAVISEILPVKFEVWFFDAQEKTYTNHLTHSILSEKMYNERNKKAGIMNSDIQKITLNIH